MDGEELAAQAAKLIEEKGNQPIALERAQAMLRLAIWLDIHSMARTLDRIVRRGVEP